MNIKHFFTSDRVVTGMLVGFLLPAAIYFSLLLAGVETSFARILGYVQGSGTTNPVYSVSVMPNLIVFYLYLNSGKRQSAWGVIYISLLYAVAIVVTKYI